jgi:hypothetical protein
MSRRAPPSARAVRSMLASPGFDVGCVHCGKPATRRASCAHCGYAYVYCQWHRDEVTQALGGHVLRVHPETLPKALAEIRRDPTALRFIFAKAAADPEGMEKLVAALEGGAPGQGGAT